MRLNDQVTRYAGASFEAVDVLGEEHTEDLALGEEADEGMADGGVEFAGVQLFRKHVEWVRVLAEVANLEDRFGVGELESRKVVVETRLGRAEVGNCADAMFSCWRYSSEPCADCTPKSAGQQG